MLSVYVPKVPKVAEYWVFVTPVEFNHDFSRVEKMLLLLYDFVYMSFDLFLV